MIRSFHIQDPIPTRDLVYWNVDVMLKFLCLEKFEPLETCDLACLTKESLFLVTLAVAKELVKFKPLVSLGVVRSKEQCCCLSLVSGLIMTINVRAFLEVLLFRI